MSDDTIESGMNSMKTNQRSFATRVSVTAVRGALITLALLPTAQAEDPATAELTRPTSTVEVGATNVSKGSYKFGEHNGLQKNGITAIGDIDLRGGAAFDSNSAQRWRITGNNLGLDSRSLNGEFGEQGKYRLTFGYDQLPWFRSDSFQTPFVNPGGNNLTLPAGWVPAGTTAGMTQLTSSMHDYKVKSERRRYDLGFSAFFAPQWEFKASFRRDTQDGVRLVGATMFDPTQGVILPALFSTQTNQAEAGIAYTGAQGHFRIGYSGSLFSNDTRALTWENPYTLGLATGQMGSAPDNQAHQLNFSGGYNFSRTTKLTLTASRGRQTQNQAFLPLDSSGTTSVANPASVNAKVITTALNLKLTARPIKDLHLAAAYKYDNRDNQTSVNTYDWVNEDSAGGVTNQNLNRPYSKKLKRINLEADYALPRQTWLKGGFDREEINRTFTEVNKTSENSYRLELRNSASEVASGRLGYVHSVRKVSSYDEFASFRATYTATDTAAYPGFLNLPGLRRFNIADRDRDQLRAAADFTASDALSFQTGLDYNRDNYTHSPFGLKDAKSWTLNLGANYAPSEKFTATVFYTYEDIRSRNDGRAFDDPAAADPWPQPSPYDPAQNWTADQRDRVNTFGASLRYNKLMAGKLDLSAILTYTRSVTMIGVSGQNIDLIPTASMPDVTSRAMALNLNGLYAVDKNSSIRVLYMYQRLMTKDWATEGVGAASVPTMIGTNQVSPNYSVHVIGASYLYKF